MILETKQVLLRAHVHSFDRRSGNAHDHFEQTIRQMQYIIKKLKVVSQVHASYGQRDHAV